MKIDFSNYKFHCSSLGLIMTDSRTKEPLGETCKTHLMECYVQEKYGRDKEIVNKYIEKGLAVEEDAITLYSRVKKKIFFKNEEVITNDFLEGTPDLFEGESILKATSIKDIKSSWDLFTFFANLAKATNKKYWWQLQGYMALTSAQNAGLAYVLVDTPDKLVNDAKRKLAWDMAVIDYDTDENYLKACEVLEKQMKFGDIPIEERWIEFNFERDNKAIGLANERVKECREFLNKLP